ncbi:sulfurtransferase [Rathayibacter soli]|uniref:sulfurtransferase n=1 Tax=Rathayibacter soli TaxID=3144168 RepID=UPI0027E552FA|nr:rhodanese-like domain-containing protein [Glaciibacter superstes]
MTSTITTVFAPDNGGTPASSRRALVGPTVSTQWLADHIGSDDLVIIDATVLQLGGPGEKPAYVNGDEEYLVHGHVPGAVFADLLTDFSDPDGRLGLDKPTAKRFAWAAASVGVDNNTRVVVYDNSVGHCAARLWWLFRAFGHDNVAVLDGGFRKWRAEQRPIDLGYVAPRQVGSFIAEERPQFWVDKAFVRAIVDGDADAVLVCALPRHEFTGQVVYRARAGHIPGSFSAPATFLINRNTNELLPLDGLRTFLADAYAPDRKIVTYCSGGLAAAAAALAFVRLGHSDVAIYDGSLNEWVLDEDAPLVTTA